MLYLRTFGGLSLENGTDPPRGAGAQRSRLALLAVLAAGADHGISRETLLSIFWPESDTEQARGALKQALYAIRRDLAAPDLITGKDALSLNAAVIRSDVAEFRHDLNAGERARAVARYRGRFLEGVHITSGEFDRWVERQRAELQKLYEDALGGLARDAEARGEHGAAVRWWRLLTSADPLSAVAASGLMRALAHTGDRGAALGHARSYEQFVRAELSVEPDPSVMELGARISRGEVANKSHDQRTLHQPVTEVSQPVPTVTTRPIAARPRRRSLATALLLVLIVVLAWAVAVPNRGQLDPDGVALTTRSDFREAALKNGPLVTALARGLVERDPTLRVTAQAKDRSRARYVVEVSAVTEGDSIRFSAAITDATSKAILRTVGPVAVLTTAAATGMSAMRDRIAVVLAAQRNPLVANWAHAVALPHTWESYEQMLLGIQAFTADNLDDARARFEAAASLDSTSVAPLVWLAFALQESSLYADADSVLRVVEQSARRSGPWEQRLTALLRVRLRGALPGDLQEPYYDLPAVHAAGHALMEAVPRSEWALLVANDVLRLGRAREAAALSEAVQRNPGWTSGWWRAAITRDQAYHVLGDYGRELAAAREALKTKPDSRLWLQMEVKALAALGRVAEVSANCERAAALRPEPARVEWWPCQQAILELAAHGYRHAARDMATRLFPARESEIAGTMNGALARAETFATIADWREVSDALNRVPSALHDYRYLELLSLVQASVGDRAGAAEAQRRLDALNVRESSPYNGGANLHRAEVAALLGDRDVALDLLERSLREGFSRIPLHWAGPFDRLRGHHRFEELVRPVEDLHSSSAIRPVASHR